MRTLEIPADLIDAIIYVFETYMPSDRYAFNAYNTLLNRLYALEALEEDQTRSDE